MPQLPLKIVSAKCWSVRRKHHGQGKTPVQGAGDLFSPDFSSNVNSFELIG